MIEALEILNFKVQFKQLTVLTEYVGFPIKETSKVRVDEEQPLGINDADLNLYCDGTLVKSVLVNLIQFISKFIKDGSKLVFRSEILQPRNTNPDCSLSASERVRASRPSLEQLLDYEGVIAPDASRQKLVIKLIDKSNSIQVEDAKKFLRLFGNLPQVKAMSDNGFYLGLVPSFAFINFYGGQLAVKKLKNKSTIFALCFPL